MAGVAQDVTDRLSQLTTNRIDHERSWRRVAALAVPDAGDFTLSHGLLDRGSVPTATAARRSEKIYDTTAVNAVDRLTSGMEALTIPRASYWHGLNVMDFGIEELEHEEKLFLERIRNLMFKVRYDNDGGWTNASRTCMKHMIGFGNSFMWVEDAINAKTAKGRALIVYKYIPLAECFIDTDHAGNVDTFYRHYSLTARQAVQKFGARCSAQIQRAAESPTDANRKFAFIHAIMPRADFGMDANKVGIAGSRYQALHIESENQNICGESGYFEFPVIDFRWTPDQSTVYAEGPVERVLADITSLNLMGKHELTAFEQSVRPALLMANAGIMNRPNSNPGQIIHGGLNPQGQEMVKPLNTGTRLDFGALVMEAKRRQVSESLYINLFQILVQNPQMTATEVLQRANEKGELLGPVGATVEQSLSNLVERELGILDRRGLYQEGGAFEVPETMENLEFGPQMSNPISRLRQTGEVEGTMQLLQILSPLAQVNPEVTDKIDAEEMVEGLADRLGVPVNFMRSDEGVLEIREQRQGQQDMAAQAAAAKDAADAGLSAAKALQIQGET